MSERLPKASDRSRLLRLAGTLISLSLLVYLFSRQWGSIIAAFSDLSIGILIGCQVLMVISRVAVGTRWYVLLHTANLDVTWGQSQKITFGGLFASNFLPTTIGGDVVRLLGAVQNNLSGSTSTASLIVDRLVGMVGMLLMLPLGLGSLWSWCEIQTTSSISISPIFPTMRMISKWWNQSVDLLQRVWHSLNLWRSKPLALAKALIFSLIHQACIYAIITLLLIDLGESLSYWVVAGFWSFIYFITLIPISINGYGVQELALTFFFTQVAGISEPAALAVAALVRLTQMIASIPGALFLPGIMAGAHQKDSYE
jgi:uncharacterized membrane protein YbhN (UPF0104 family)